MDKLLTYLIDPLNLGFAAIIISMGVVAGFYADRRINKKAKFRLKQALEIFGKNDRRSIYDEYEKLKGRLLKINGFGADWREFDEGCGWVILHRYDSTDGRSAWENDTPLK